ncbi:hypothetical protein MHI27_11820 [Paenibacillus sp. FSL H8-0261]|uniref:hypothetical protein n=1 Tax=Paenibacillus sp. FSL H8-0261 TaxID=2921381 RepID=UPI003246623A
MGVSHLNNGGVLVLFILLVIISKILRNPATATSSYLNGTSGGGNIPVVSHNKNVMMKNPPQNMLLGPIGTCAITTKGDKCYCWNNLSEDTCTDYVYEYQKANQYKGHIFTQVLNCEDINNPTKCEIQN